MPRIWVKKLLWILAVSFYKQYQFVCLEYWSTLESFCGMWYLKTILDLWLIVYFQCIFMYLIHNQTAMVKMLTLNLKHLISKWKPIRRIFYIIIALKWLWMPGNKAFKNVSFQESHCSCIHIFYISTRWLKDCIVKY